MQCHYTETGKFVKLDGIALPTGEVMETIDDEGYKYLGILELDEIMEERMKGKFMNEYYRRLRLVLKSKLNETVAAPAR